MTAVRTGAQELLSNPGIVPGKRWGLVTNYTAVTPALELVATQLHRETGTVAAILSPEHGLRGTAQAGYAESSGNDPLTGLPVVDTYGKEAAVLDAEIASLDLDVLVADVQDAGARFYTYVWTVVDCLRSAARLGIPFYVLDRPNPVSGAIASGPGLLPAYRSFVGRLDIPVRHGLTLGEITREAAARDLRDGVPATEPTVIKMQGWDRSMYWAQTGLPWVMPSPNLPTPDTALAYLSTCFFEGTNMSEGRGTTRPFELIGAPWLDSEYCARLNELALPGVRFREASFVPTFSKHCGEPVTGVQLHVLDPAAFEPVRTGVSMLEAARRTGGDQFQWRLPSWEEKAQRPAFIDLLWGSDTLRTGLEQGFSVDEVISSAPTPPENLADPLY